MPLSPLDPEFWAAVRRLFERIDSLPPDARDAALDTDAAAAAVKAEVRSLLVHARTEARAPGLLDRPAAVGAHGLPPPVAPPDDAGPSLRSGQRLGPW